LLVWPKVTAKEACNAPFEVYVLDDISCMCKPCCANDDPCIQKK
jgi:hypothetical protein